MATWRGAAASKRLALAFWKFSRRSRTGKFGSLLGLHPEELGGTTRMEFLGPKNSIVSTEIPAWTCENGKMRLEAAVALLDEISTYAGCCMWDQRCRPGFSIQLQGRALRPIDVGAGERIKVETRLQRVGRTIGFLDIVISDEDGDPLISASHLKFMHSGAIFDLAFRPPFQETTRKLWEYLVLDRQPEHEFTMPSTFEEVFKIKEEENNFGAEDEAPVELAGLVSLDARHGNPVGSIHGGAATMLGAHAAALAVRKRPEFLSGEAAGAPTMVRVNLLSGIATHRPAEAHVRAQVVKDPPQAALPGSLHAHTRILNEQGNLCIECETVHAAPRKDRQ
ncbi:Hypothetical Protein FCC1311_061382 [Hondaea fermentalgiana]|uniref:Uncharacterized protein n=1 Tax=Hondaea fermentalgiana TaxID=2315210 RepID=A0A2R5GJK3_9STRA|nr:Hypothetical Protein FCC1311_061382 [Hondaea fermentalgiana]|eukprot:GBG29918.1 Hypothetical Protein FCC1311_061382 [Hondaea fermentalgiana]